ncbi:ATP-binding cassette domain-containing protein [Streptobacillus ratti]|uniref:ATP-binding cassette domain-containing protein n=1 Tax=Streptobacillus ratti TaxID=1720557 RepID=UPI0009321DD4|nr:ATP-binding cassette domain-containing protein [Streptobacillus ratti]
MKINNLLVKKSNIEILKIDSLDIDVSKSIAIFGENCAGKTTFIKCILGIEDYNGSISDLMSNNQIQVLLQNNNYPPYAKVKDIIRLVLDKQELSCLSELFRIFNFEHNLNKKIGSLSGGELQKLNLILIFSKPHKLLIVDEITTGLDYSTRMKLLEYLKNHIDKMGIGLIIVSHYLEEIKYLCDEVIVLEKGKVSKQLNTEDFLKNFIKEGKNYV